ncbi:MULTISPECIES: hypothetical protein [Pseudomonas]|jgi:hypothetical protein|uniref:Uncharacterized protein n=1 Tax=Pseudomonas putida TaxID=303 RepID=A0A7Y8D0D9_PSEPU|nr:MULTISPECIES: hypothetical protein [Pseudomonas]MBG6125087.1 hypothetical protein [Pseudomonas sp. M2]MBM7398899.1 hypothetical protein [Pseudomonas sp. M5]NSX18469.1 hypothetical protein [Pseudomonas putida]NWC80342.1 hypothetical protein [Pseudomonas putida]HDS1745458.1 hypothetical protein [Pseudomonas putida]
MLRQIRLVRAFVTEHPARSKGLPQVDDRSAESAVRIAHTRQRLVFRGLRDFLGCQSVPSKQPEKLSMAQIVAELILY